jgi:hypothetical protein
MDTMTRSLRFATVLTVAAASLGVAGTASGLQAASTPNATSIHRIHAAPVSAVMVRAADILRQPTVETALRSFGFRPERLSRVEERMLEDAYRDLFPNSDPRRARLNHSQGTALVYIALVHSDRGGPRRPNRRACDEAIQQVYNLDRLFDAPGRGRPRHLTAEEQRTLARETHEIHRNARSCGESSLADHADRLGSLLAERRVEREQVARQVERMRATARGAIR